MKTWTKHVLMTDGFPVTVYVNAANTQAYIFPLFGRYFGISSDVSALDMATTFIVAKHGNEVSFASYLMSNEDTAITNINDLEAA